MNKNSSKVRGEVNPGVFLVWVRGTPSHLSRLSGNVTREINTYLQPLLCLAWVNYHQVRYYDFRTQTIRLAIPLQTAIQASWNSRWTVVDAERLVLCGGSDVRSYLQLPWQTAYEVHRSGRVQQLPDMLEGRSCCGMVVWKFTVHVFGSYQGQTLARCESLGLREPTQCERLPDMHKARAKFTPSLWQEAVYLCGGIPGNDTMETFDGHRMKLLGVRLPEGGTSLSCVDRDSLLVLSCNHSTILSSTGASEALSVTARIVKHRPYHVFAFTEPVLYQGEMHCFYCGKVERYRIMQDFSSEKLTAATNCPNSILHVQ